jgi:hypothetical protein
MFRRAKLQQTPKQYQCRHIFTDGRRCASPCLRQEEFCYYHHTTRKPVADPRRRRSRRSTFQLPLPEDRSAIQSSIGEVLQRIASNDIDPRRAGLLLYGLQIASLNLAQSRPATKPSPEPETVEEITIDPTLGVLAPRAEVSKATTRKSPIAQLIDDIIQNKQKETEQKEADSTGITVLPTVQATEATTSDDILIRSRTSSNRRNTTKHSMFGVPCFVQSASDTEGRSVRGLRPKSDCRQGADRRKSLWWHIAECVEVDHAVIVYGSHHAGAGIGLGSERRNNQRWASGVDRKIARNYGRLRPRRRLPLSIATASKNSLVCQRPAISSRHLPLFTHSTHTELHTLGWADGRSVRDLDYKEGRAESGGREYLARMLQRSGSNEAPFSNTSTDQHRRVNGTT